MTTFSDAGETLVIRPIQAADFELERTFARGLSPETGTLRLMSPRAPSDDEMRRWTDVDQQREVAFIAVTVGAEEERAVGVARYAVDDTGKAAEFAIVIGDAWQHRGLGRALLTELIAHARQAGLRQLFGPTLSENAAMVGLARSLGFSARRDAGEAYIINLTLELGPP